jgi:hypothetical protein
VIYLCSFPYPKDLFHFLGLTWGLETACHSEATIFTPILEDPDWRLAKATITQDRKTPGRSATGQIKQQVPTPMLASFTGPHCPWVAVGEPCVCISGPPAMQSVSSVPSRVGRWAVTHSLSFFTRSSG